MLCSRHRPTFLPLSAARRAFPGDLILFDSVYLASRLKPYAAHGACNVPPDMHAYRGLCSNRFHLIIAMRQAIRLLTYNLPRPCASAQPMLMQLST